MAIVMEANYSKKLGLPGFSSHQFSLTLRTEIADLTQVQAESARLYKLWCKDGRDCETACRFEFPEDAENYARVGLAAFPEVEQFALLRRRPGKRERVRMINRENGESNLADNIEPDHVRPKQ